jgi:hypothetical protein
MHIVITESRKKIQFDWNSLSCPQRIHPREGVNGIAVW